MKNTSILLAVLVAAAFATAFATAQAATSNSPFCQVANGVLTLVNTPASTQCIQRSDQSSAYLQPGGQIGSPFIFGASVEPHNLVVTVSLFSDLACSVSQASVTCDNVPDTECVLNHNYDPILINVASPALCVRRDDTGATFPIAFSFTPRVIPLGNVTVSSDLCPVQINLFKDTGCTQYLRTQEIMCPCKPSCNGCCEYGTLTPDA